MRTRKPKAAVGWLVTLALATVLAIVLGGCGGGDGAAPPTTASVAAAPPVETRLAAYISSQGLAGEPMDDGCTDAQFEQDRQHLWKCTVYVGDDVETWDVAVEDGRVVDASPEG